MSLKFFTLFVTLYCWMLSKAQLSSYSGRQRKEITSIAGSIGQVPCYVESLDDAAMILWFKESSRTPIYSYDGRNEAEPPRHFPLKNDLGLRLHFRIPTAKSSSSSTTRPPALLIRNLKPSDAGTYRCRIDYRNSPTTSHVIKLNVIQLPSRLEIQDTSEYGPISDQQISPSTTGQEEEFENLQNDITYIGPYIEGRNVTISCTAFGGLPLPEVTWYRNGVLLDSSYELIGNDSVSNKLGLIGLTRNHSQDLFTCQASNTNETKPISHRVNVEVYTRVKHIDVKIPDELTVGGIYTFVCLTDGAYPAVKVEFWKLQKRIGPRYQTKSDVNDTSTHRIEFQPEVGDDEAFVSCKAENPWISQNFIEGGRKLNVVYPPLVILRFGSSKRANFSEGESILLECHVKSNPPFKRIRWIHQKKELFEDLGAGIQLNGMTLVLRHLTHESHGTYACEAFNDVGKGLSNILNLRVNVSPKCLSNSERIIPLAKGEKTQVDCHILAWPPDLNFYWTLNQSGDILPISSLLQNIKLNMTKDEILSKEKEHLNNTSPKSKLRNLESVHRDWLKSSSEMRLSSFDNDDDVILDRIFHQSSLLYQVNSVNDYGIVGCWAKNSYAKQIFPCNFHIVPPIENGKEIEKKVNMTGGVIIEDTFSIKRRSSASSTTSNNKEEEDKRKNESLWLESSTKLRQRNSSLMLLGVLIFITILALTSIMWFLIHVKRKNDSTRTSNSTTITHTQPDGGIPQSNHT